MTPQEIIQRLMQFRWHYKVYGQYVCPSCGALAEHDDNSGIKRIEECSPSCPFRQAEEWLKDNE